MILLLGDLEPCKTLAAYLTLSTGGRIYPLPGGYLSRDLQLVVKGGKAEYLEEFFFRNPFSLLIGDVWLQVKDWLDVRQILTVSSAVPTMHKEYPWLNTTKAEWWVEGLDILGEPPSGLRFEDERVKDFAAQVFDPSYTLWLRVATKRSGLFSFYNQSDSPIQFGRYRSACPATMVTGGEMRMFSKRASPLQVLMRIEYNAESEKSCDPFVLRDPPLIDRVISTTPCVFPSLPVEIVHGFGSWVSSALPLDFGSLVTGKTSLVSLVASAKTFLSGHRLRHKIAKAFGPTYKIDLLGGGYRQIDTKEEGHLAYYYSIVIENEISSTFLTEKLTDCLRCGCVALYWGARSVHQIYDKGSVLTWRTPEELKALLDACSLEDYMGRQDAIQKNIYLAQARCSLGRCLALDTSLTWDLRLKP
jgi:hypothetical protein